MTTVWHGIVLEGGMRQQWCQLLCGRQSARQRTHGREAQDQPKGLYTFLKRCPPVLINRSACCSKIIMLAQLCIAKNSAFLSPMLGPAHDGG